MTENKRSVDGMACVRLEFSVCQNVLTQNLFSENVQSGWLSARHTCLSRCLTNHAMLYTAVYWLDIILIYIIMKLWKTAKFAASQNIKLAYVLHRMRMVCRRIV